MKKLFTILFFLLLCAFSVNLSAQTGYKQVYYRVNDSTLLYNDGVKWIILAAKNTGSDSAYIRLSSPNDSTLVLNRKNPLKKDSVIYSIDLSDAGIDNNISELQQLDDSTLIFIRPSGLHDTVTLGTNDVLTQLNSFGDYINTTYADSMAVKDMFTQFVQAFHNCFDSNLHKRCFMIGDPGSDSLNTPVNLSLSFKTVLSETINQLQYFQYNSNTWYSGGAFNNQLNWLPWNNFETSVDFTTADVTRHLTELNKFLLLADQLEKTFPGITQYGYTATPYQHSLTGYYAFDGYNLLFDLLENLIL